MLLTFKIIWFPYWLLTGSLVYSPSFNLYDAFQNSETTSDLVNPSINPPFSLEPVSSEFSLASFSKSAPLFKSLIKFWASYNIEYEATGSNGKSRKATVIVMVKDTTKPTITIANATTEISSAGSLLRWW